MSARKIVARIVPVPEIGTIGPMEQTLRNAAALTGRLIPADGLAAAQKLDAKLREIALGAA